MAIQTQGIPLNRIFTFAFQDRSSRNRLLVAVGFSLASMLVPIIPSIFVSGYTVQFLRKTVREGGPAMPAWSDWNRMLIDGLLSMIISTIYLLPGMLMLFGGMIAYFISSVAILPAMESDATSTLLLMFLPLVILGLTMLVGLPLLLAGAIPLPIALARFADEERFGAAFQLGAIWRSLKANPVGYFAAWVVSIGLWYLGSFIYGIAYSTVILCCFGYVFLLAAGTWTGLVLYAMIGLAYRESKQPAGSASPPTFIPA